MSFFTTTLFRDQLLAQLIDYPPVFVPPEEQEPTSEEEGHYYTEESLWLSFIGCAISAEDITFLTRQLQNVYWNWNTTGAAGGRFAGVDVDVVVVVSLYLEFEACQFLTGASASLGALWRSSSSSSSESEGQPPQTMIPAMASPSSSSSSSGMMIRVCGLNFISYETTTTTNRTNLAHNNHNSTTGSVALATTTTTRHPAVVPTFAHLFFHTTVPSTIHSSILTSRVREIQLLWVGIPVLFPLQLLVDGLGVGKSESSGTHYPQTLGVKIRRCCCGCPQTTPSERDAVLRLLGTLIQTASRTAINLTLVLSCMPDLFSGYKKKEKDRTTSPRTLPKEEGVGRGGLKGGGAPSFVSACYNFPRRGGKSGLKLSNVGVTEQLAVDLCRAMIQQQPKQPPPPHHHHDDWRKPPPQSIPESNKLQFFHLSGRRFMGNRLWEQLLERLPWIGANVKQNFALVDQDNQNWTPPPQDLDDTNHHHQERLFHAVSRNRHTLPHVKLRLGTIQFPNRQRRRGKPDRKRVLAIQQSIADLHGRVALARTVLKTPSLVPLPSSAGCWRNFNVDTTSTTTDQETKNRGQGTSSSSSGATSGIMAQVLAKLGDSESGRDAVYFLLTNLFLCQ